MRRFFHPVGFADSVGLSNEALAQSQNDFFINGTITCHSASPEHMAGLWLAGREIALVNGHLPAWLKKAMGAALSEVNKCPYCEDMLLSLTLGADEKNLADSLRENDLNQIKDESTRKIMQWTKASQSKHSDLLRNPPFTEEQMPEALGTLIVFGYTNKISDFALEGSPVPKLGRGVSLKLFGLELKESAEMELKPGLSLGLLPEGELPGDLEWSRPAPLVAKSLARWNKVLANGVSEVLSVSAQEIILNSLAKWEGGPSALSRAWVEKEIKDVPAYERNRAGLALLVAKASYQIDDSVIQELADEGASEADLVRLGAWAAFAGAKTAANWCWEACFQGNKSNNSQLSIV